MEVFQTIWNSITTENEIATVILGIPSIFIETYVSVLIFTMLLNVEASKKNKLIYISIISLLGIISRVVIPDPYGSYANMIFILLAIKIVFKTTIFKSIIALVVPVILEILIEVICSRIYVAIFKIDYVIGMNIPLHRFLQNLIVCFIMYCIYLILKYFKINFSKIQVLNKRNKISLIMTVVFGIVLLATQLYIITFYTYALPTFVTLINIISIFTYVIVSFYSIFTVSKLEKTSMNLEEEKLYNKTLQILHDNIRAFKHDFFNIVQGIGGYIGNNDMEGLKSYYEKLLDDCQQANNLAALNPSVVNNPAIYNILATKYHTADELGIKINLEVFMDLNELNINSYELTRILGILINNAIEASQECEDKTINICFRKDKRKNMQIIQIQNTYKDKDIDTEKIYEKNYTTKDGNTGIGLWEVRQILKKHNNLNLFTSKDSDFFSQQFEIYY